MSSWYLRTICFHIKIFIEQNSTNESESKLYDINEEEEREWEQMYTETEAAQYTDTATGDITIIKTGDYHAYYLLSLT